MKKNTILIIIFLALAISAVYLYNEFGGKTTMKRLVDFAVEDTASVDMIFMVDMDKNQVVLERKNNAWLVNNKYIARQGSIDKLLETMKNLEVKEFIPQSRMNTTIRVLSSHSTKVEIYQKGELNKTYYVGGATQNQSGTYMLLENSSQPCVVTIPGFLGYLSTRYFIEESLWRDPTVFNSNEKDIASVKMEFLSDKTKSLNHMNLFHWRIIN